MAPKKSYEKLILTHLSSTEYISGLTLSTNIAESVGKDRSAGLFMKR